MPFERAFAAYAEISARMHIAQRDTARGWAVGLQAHQPNSHVLKGMWVVAGVIGVI